MNIKKAAPDAGQLAFNWIVSFSSDSPFHKIPALHESFETRFPATTTKLSTKAVGFAEI